MNKEEMSKAEKLVAETIYPNDGFTDSVETNVLLEIEEDEI